MKTMFEQAISKGLANGLEYYAALPTQSHKQQVFQIRLSKLAKQAQAIEAKKERIIEDEGVMPFEDRPAHTQEILRTAHEEEQKIWDAFRAIIADWNK